MSLTFAAVTAPDTAAEALLARHVATMQAASPAESCHVMTAKALRDEGARVFALRRDGATVAVGAFKPLPPGVAPALPDWPSGPVVELKSMHVAEAYRGLGLGAALLHHLLDAAQTDGAVGACLETGTEIPFTAARALYRRHGFTECAPFGDYVADPLSVFMARRLVPTE